MQWQDILTLNFFFEVLFPGCFSFDNTETQFVELQLQHHILIYETISICKMKMELLAPFVSVEVPENCFKVTCYRLLNALRPNLCLNES